MSFWIYILTDIIHILKILLLCETFFMFNKRVREHKKVVFVMTIFFMSIMSMIIYLCHNEFLQLLLSTIAIVTMICGLYKERFISIFTCSVWIFLIISMLDTMAIVLVELICGMMNVQCGDISDVVADALSLVIVLTIGRVYYNKYKEGIKGIGAVNLILFTILAFADTFVVMVMAGITKNENQGQHKILYSIAFIIVILGIFIQLGAVILLLMQRNVYKEKKQITEKYLNEQINHYEYLEKRELETKKFRHDLINHMQMMSNLANNGQYNKIDDYLETINIKIDNFGNVVTVQNGIVDAIINQYYSMAVQDDVDMQVKGIFPRDCTIDAYDLCTIFSNILSNALEATVEADEKRIALECRYNDKNIIIVVKNTFKDVGQFDGDKLKTRKDNINYHGYGLTNIRESIDKYNGVLDIEIKNGEFILTILLNYIGKRDYEDSSHR